MGLIEYSAHEIYNRDDTRHRETVYIASEVDALLQQLQELANRWVNEMYDENWFGTNVEDVFMGCAEELRAILSGSKKI